MVASWACEVTETLTQRSSEEAYLCIRIRLHCQPSYITLACKAGRQFVPSV